jgi:hypothetical protein
MLTHQQQATVKPARAAALLSWIGISVSFSMIPGQCHVMADGTTAVYCHGGACRNPQEEQMQAESYMHSD